MTTDALKRGERTRHAILEAAQELFLENGYGGTSMRQIAEQAGGIAVGGIYNHFGSKQEIIVEIIRLQSPAPLMTAALEEVRGETGPELLADALRRLSALAVEHIDFIQLAYIDVQKFDGAAMIGVVGDMMPSVMSFARRVTDAGGLRGDVNPFAMMRMLVSLMIGYALTERMAFADGRPRVDIIPDIPQAQWINSLVDVYLHGVAAEE
jgi:AcrR family transcriptional regulator